MTQLRLGGKPVFVIGGAQLYRGIALVDALELTEVHSDIAGDTQFPFWDRGQFDEASRAPQPAEASLAFDFVTYRRKH
jgi:dihydrofolate reductase